MSSKLIIHAGYLVFNGVFVLHYSRNKDGAKIFCDQQGLQHSAIEQIFYYKPHDKLEKQVPWNGLYEPNGQNILTPVETK